MNGREFATWANAEITSRAEAMGFVFDSKEDIKTIDTVGGFKLIYLSRATLPGKGEPEFLVGFWIPRFPQLVLLRRPDGTIVDKGTNNHVETISNS